MTELTKEQKKIARNLIDLGLERECKGFNNTIRQIVCKPMESKERANHSRYLEVYKATADFDRHIADRYDGMGGSRYFMTIVNLYCEGIITDEEIAELGKEALDMIHSIISLR